uniref:Uncharacterized protein n=1 Tax=Physcomitrium patens TaxID=3218 RepID=A0A2K1J1X0_PHYPA|nr:hypothetical protein PHYPA_023426 [Physcomitrium patens]
MIPIKSMNFGLIGGTEDQIMRCNLSKIEYKALFGAMLW